MLTKRALLAAAPGASGTTRRIGLVSQGTLVFNIGLYKSPGYDSLKDLTTVVVSGGVSNVLIVHPDNPARTVADGIGQLPQVREKMLAQGIAMIPP